MDSVKAVGNGMSRSKFISKAKKPGAPQSTDDRKPCSGEPRMSLVEAKRSLAKMGGVGSAMGVGEGRLGVIGGARDTEVGNTKSASVGGVLLPWPPSETEPRVLEDAELVSVLRARSASV